MASQTSFSFANLLCLFFFLQRVPSGLSDEIMVLILDGNPKLRQLKEDEFKTAGLLNLQRLSVRRCQVVHVDENAFR